MESLAVLVTLLISWFCGSLVSCTETTVSHTIQNMPTSPAQTPEQFLNISPRRRTTSSLEVRWKVPDGYILSKSYLEAKRMNSGDQGVSVVTPDLGNATSKYEISDLMTNSKYEICLYAEVTKIDPNITSDMEENIVRCTTMSTVPLIRADSLIVLFCVIGYLLLMILIGYLCWRRAHKQKEEQLLNDEDDSDEEEKARENGDQSKPILLSAPPPQQQQRPRSAIEDEDIPYITPPWDQIEKEKQQ